METGVFLAAAGGMVVATYLLRLAGVYWGSRLDDRLRVWLDRATVVILVAVAATQTVFDGQDVAGVSRITGVAVGVLALWWKTPMLAAVLLAMLVTALLRLAGIP